MTSGQQLLANLTDGPDDPTVAARGVYADWLEEHPEDIREALRVLTGWTIIPHDDPRFGQTKYVVEATSNEMHQFWCMWAHNSPHRRYPGQQLHWEQDGMGGVGHYHWQ